MYDDCYSCVGNYLMFINMQSGIKQIFNGLTFLKREYTFTLISFLISSKSVHKCFSFYYSYI